MKNLLPKRTLEVLKYACLRNNVIAKKLTVSPTTIATHFFLARNALCARTKETALIAAIKRGMIKVEDVVLDEN